MIPQRCLREINLTNSCKLTVNMKTSALQNCCFLVREKGRFHKHRPSTSALLRSTHDSVCPGWAEQVQPGARLPPKLRHGNQTRATAAAKQTTEEESIIVMRHYGDDRRGRAAAVSPRCDGCFCPRWHDHRFESHCSDKNSQRLVAGKL